MEPRITRPPIGSSSISRIRRSEPEDYGGSERLSGPVGCRWVGVISSLVPEPAEEACPLLAPRSRRTEKGVRVAKPAP